MDSLVRKNLPFLLATLLFAQGCTIGFSDHSPVKIRPTKIVRNDPGGLISTYAFRVGQLQKHDGKVRISGKCQSACTLYLALPRKDVCITPNAQFGFHYPSKGTPGNKRRGANYMMRKYPYWVRSWIRSRNGLRNRMMVMDYRYASRYLPTCKATLFS